MPVLVMRQCLCLRLYNASEKTSKKSPTIVIQCLRRERRRAASMQSHCTCVQDRLAHYVSGVESKMWNITLMPLDLRAWRVLTRTRCTTALLVTIQDVRDARCRVPHLHYTRMCPVLYTIYPFCHLRGHQGGCSTTKAWLVKALADVEEVADEGVITIRR